MTDDQPWKGVPNEGIKYLDPDEFVSLGLLQEANRLFFHPRGLALEVHPPVTRFHRPLMVVGVWDDRDDPTRTTAYAPGVIDEAKIERVAAMVRNDPQPPS